MVRPGDAVDVLVHVVLSTSWLSRQGGIDVDVEWRPARVVRVATCGDVEAEVETEDGPLIMSLLRSEYGKTWR